MSNQLRRLMIVGADGGLGGDLREIVANETDWSLIEVTRDRVRAGGIERAFDSGSRAEWRALFDSDLWRPDVVVNTAAMTNVDACETRKIDAWKNNVTLVEHIVGECKRHDRKLVQLSTDYIFDGTGGPYSESSTPRPTNYYGKTKLAAENACIGGEINVAIVRTMWLYGEQRKGKTSFVTWLVDTLSSGGTARVVTDEIGNPTFQNDVAYGILRVIEKDYQGVVNIAGPELISRWKFAETIAEVHELDPGRLIPIASSDLQRLAKRPLDSGLISLRAQTILGLRLTTTKDGLEICKILEQRTAR
jgi:dTDP-4-dehydrorhamnose reductase